MLRIDRRMARNKLDDLVDSPRPDGGPHGEMNVSPSTGLEAPLSICGLTVRRIFFSLVGLLIVPEWHAEKISSHHPGDLWQRGIGSFLCPWSDRKWFNPTIADSKPHRRQVPSLPGYSRLHATGL